KQALITTTLKR
ncbi:oxygen-insensitive NAD(P)H nitroreductase, partial [Vibrio parahaemolyticus V-223/04]